MIVGFNQKSIELLCVMNDYGCYFLCLAEASPIIFSGSAGIQRLNGIWSKAMEEGLISSDLNHDGDYDDAGEAEIQNVTLLAQKYFKLKLKYDGLHHDASEIIPPEVKLVIGQFFWKGGHFVIINKSKKVTYDSLGKSNSVKNGKLKTMRWFYAV